MSNPELLILSALRVLVEVALLSLLAQGAVGLLSGARRQANPIYRLFQVVTRPVIRIARFVTPRAVIDRHIPFVAFFLLFWLWIFLAWAKRFLAA
ncbi:MAG: hypothetical protein OHM77_06965 [Candidatus Nitricoxidivorans perseverans]|uniref:YggT family protein n=1 Tax=Candidatus Nitricoxidivorans perseverans TaxID=2975601 RepID=A0AA49IQY6_9PROT|nr:MAG: hypothetical protein OHM77_06965 [Candidatus Nitricoxidivorans perseverans]